MNTKFEDIVQSLDPATLEELRRSVAAELATRNEAMTIKIEDIHPRMSAEDKDRAAQVIARVLRGEDSNA